MTPIPATRDLSWTIRQERPDIWSVRRGGLVIADGLLSLSACLAFIAKAAMCEEKLAEWLAREIGARDPVETFRLDRFDVAPLWLATYHHDGGGQMLRTNSLGEAVRFVAAHGGKEWLEALNIDPEWFDEAHR